MAGGAAAGLDGGAGGLAHFLATLGVTQQIDDRGGEGIGRGDAAAAGLGEEEIHGFGEVVRVGADEEGFGEAGDLHDVGAAHGDEAAADEDDGGEGVELAKFAHGVAEEDGEGLCDVGWHEGAAGAAAEAGVVVADDETGDFIEAFGAAGDDGELEVGDFFAYAGVGGEDELLFAGAGAAADPERFVGGDAHILGEVLLAVDVIGEVGGVVLDRAGDFDAVCGDAELEEAGLVGGVLGADPGEFAEHTAGDGADEGPFETADALLGGNAAVGDDDGDVVVAGDFDEVGPGFQLEEDNGGGTDATEDAADSEREVEREAEGDEVGVE